MYSIVLFNKSVQFHDFESKYITIKKMSFSVYIKIVADNLKNDIEIGFCCY